MAVYKLVAEGRGREALAQAESLARDYPNFQLAQLAVGDLLMSRTRPLRHLGDVAPEPDSARSIQAAAALAELRHAEFGAVHVRIATTSERLDVSLSAADPDFARTVQAAAPIATSTATSDSTAQGQGSGGAYGQSASGAAQGQGSGSGGHHTASTAQPRGERQNDARETRSQRETREDTPADPRRRGILA